MYRIDTAIKSICPLLMHRFPMPEEEQKLRRKVGKPTEEDWETEYRLSMYLTEDGELYQPAEHIHSMLQKAALNFQIPGRGKKTYKDLVTGAVLVEPAVLIHKIQNAVPDRRRVRINKAAIVRTRAKLPEWELDFTLDVGEDQLPESVLNEILSYGGRRVGIGDYRPIFGRFEITKFQRL